MLTVVKKSKWYFWIIHDAILIPGKIFLPSGVSWSVHFILKTFLKKNLKTLHKKEIHLHIYRTLSLPDYAFRLNLNWKHSHEQCDVIVSIVEEMINITTDTSITYNFNYSGGDEIFIIQHWFPNWKRRMNLFPNCDVL